MIWEKIPIRMLSVALLVTFNFISCQKEIDFQCQSNSKHKFVSKGFVHLDIDSLTTNRPYSLQYGRFEEKDLLSFINFHYNEIQLYDLNSGLLTKKLKFDQNIFGEISGYFIQSLDSIFIVSSNKMKAFLVNRDLEEIQSFNLENTQGSPIPVSNLNVFYLDQKLYIINQFAINDKKGVKNESLISVFDYSRYQENGNFDTFSFLSFPEIYDEPYSPELGLYFPAVDFQNRNLYLSFSVSHTLFKYSTSNHALDSQFEMKPSEAFKIESSKRKNISQFVDRQLYYLENHNYGNIVFDPFQNLLFRLAYYPVDDAQSIMANSREILKRRKLLVSNLGDYQLELETCLDQDLYYEGLMIGTPLGMLINKYSNDEDKILFEIFKVEKSN